MPSILGAIVPPLHCCRRAIATALLPRCPPPPPCRCRAIASTLLLCCRCRAATDGCREAGAVAVMPPPCCHRRLCFYCPCRRHRCHATVRPPLDAVTPLLPLPYCCAAHRCLPTTMLPAATAPTPRQHRAATAIAVPPPRLLTAAIAMPLPPSPCCYHHRHTAATSAAVLPTPPATAASTAAAATAAAAAAAATAATAAAAAAVALIFLSLFPPPTMLRCCLASGDAAALPPTWLRRQSNVPFLWHGEAAKNGRMRVWPQNLVVVELVRFFITYSFREVLKNIILHFVRTI
jgi:hypothetical protein